VRVHSIIIARLWAERYKALASFSGSLIGSSNLLQIFLYLDHKKIFSSIVKRTHSIAFAYYTHIMHEVSICQSILTTIEDEFDPATLQNIREVYLKVGMLSCIEPRLLVHTFDYMKAGGPFQNSQLFVDLVEVSAECKECGDVFKVEKYTFVCPQCGTPVSNITEGKELLIHKIIIEEAKHAEIN